MGSHSETIRSKESPKRRSPEPLPKKGASGFSRTFFPRFPPPPKKTEGARRAWAGARKKIDCRRAAKSWRRSVTKAVAWPGAQETSERDPGPARSPWPLGNETNGFLFEGTQKWLPFWRAPFQGKPKGNHCVVSPKFEDPFILPSRKKNRVRG